MRNPRSVWVLREHDDRVVDSLILLHVRHGKPCQLPTSRPGEERKQRQPKRGLPSASNGTLTPREHGRAEYELKLCRGEGLAVRLVFTKTHVRERVRPRHVIWNDASLIPCP